MKHILKHIQERTPIYGIEFFIIGNGKILTSYKIRDDIINTLEKHKELFQSKYERKVVSDEFSKRVREIYERLTRV